MAMIRRVWNIPVALGWMIMSFIVFTAFGLVSMNTFYQTNADADLARAQSFAVYAYRAQIDDYALCLKSAAARADLRDAIGKLYDFIIGIGTTVQEQNGSPALHDRAIAAKAEFDTAFKNPDPTTCKVPVAPANLPANLTFDIPTTSP
jgi:hypothetical protein